MIRKFDKKYTSLLVTVAVLVLGYLFLVFIAPDITVWSYSYSFNPEDSCYVELEEGDVYESRFIMPFQRVNKVDIFIYDVLTENDLLVPVNAQLELIDPEGNTILCKTVTSVFDMEMSGGYADVTEEGIYTLRLSVNDIDAPEGVTHPKVLVSGDSMCYSLYGGFSGTPSKTVFTVLYCFIGGIVALYVYSKNSKSPSLRKNTEDILFIVISLISILLLCQRSDLEIISRGALKIIESLKSGSLLSFYNYCYEGALTYGTDMVHFGYDCDFFIYLPIAILMFPVSFFLRSDTPYWSGFYGVVVLVELFIFGLLLLSGKLLGRLCRSCGMSEEYADYVRKFFLFSPFVICASILFGQIDMIYIVVVIIALIFYFKGNYKAFTLLMSLAVAMKSLPLVIFIPLILLVKKNPLHIAAHGAGVLLFPAVSTLLFERSYGYTAILNITDNEFGFSNWLFNPLSGTNISLLAVLYVFVCVYAYAHKTSEDDKEDQLKTVMLLIFASYSILAAFIEWHIQWMLPLMLSLSFLVPMYRRNRTVVTLSVVFEIFLIIRVLANNQISAYFVNFLLAVLMDHQYRGVFGAEVLANIHPHCYVVIVSAASALSAALCYCFLRKKAMSADDTGTEIKDFGFVACFRIAAVYALAVLLFWCYSFIG